MISSLFSNIYNVVECFEWFQDIQDSNCLTLSLINNNWANWADIEGLDSPKIKTMLIKKLSKYYDGNIHSNIDLGMREETSDKGSLCGMAAVYQAAQQTILTISQLKQMSYDDVKIAIGEVLGITADDSKKAKDVELLTSYYEGKQLMF